MSICKECGAHIDWIRMRDGKTVPVDETPVFVIEGGGMETFVIDEGDVITGRKASAEEENRELPVAYVPHWATCRKAGGQR